MLNPKYIRENIEDIRAQFAARDPSICLDEFVELYDQKKESQEELRKIRELKNLYSASISHRRRDGRPTDRLIEAAKELSASESYARADLTPVEKRLDEILLNLPNRLHPLVPRSSDEEDYVIEKTYGKKRNFSFTPKDHMTVATNLGAVDMDRARKLTGAKFVIYRGCGAELERALQNFYTDTLLNSEPFMGKKFELVSPPLLVNEDTMRTAGTLPKFKDEVYFAMPDGYILVPTSEVALVGQYREERFDPDDLPILNTAFTHCYRREAGGSGKKDKGIARLHDFTKQEMVAISMPEYSHDVLQHMRSVAESMVEMLELPGRTILLSAGDLGQQCAITYDIEVHFPAQGIYREVSSCSDCLDYQARRGNIRVKKEKGKGSVLAHTLNGTALAVPRTIISILENYQEQDGRVRLPDVLQGYMGRKYL